MRVIGLAHLDALAEGRVAEVKMVFNKRGAVVFCARSQHREMRVEGISYEDDHRGNALAALLRPGHVEVRYHSAFSDIAVAQLMRKLFASPEFERIAGARVTYQGRPLLI